MISETDINLRILADGLCENEAQKEFMRKNFNKFKQIAEEVKKTGHCKVFFPRKLKVSKPKVSIACIFTAVMTIWLASIFAGDAEGFSAVFAFSVLGVFGVILLAEHVTNFILANGPDGHALLRLRTDLFYEANNIVAEDDRDFSLSCLGVSFIYKWLAAAGVESGMEIQSEMVYGGFAVSILGREIIVIKKDDD